MDLHPRPEAFRRVEVRLGDRITLAGRLGRKAAFVADIVGAETALQSAQSEGLFLLEEETEFDFAEHYDSDDAWTECLTGPRVGPLDADEGSIASARASMPTGGGEIIVTGREWAARLRRIQ